MTFIKTLKQTFKESPFIISLAIGIAVRAFFVFRGNFPIGDGGMFYTMIEELKQNQFILPSVTLYNDQNIPFAYPPFSFYITGFISVVFNINTLHLLHFVPFIITIFTLILFYMLAQKLLGKSCAFFASLAFALLPRSFEWQIMGGGITRSFSMFFAICAIYFFLANTAMTYRSLWKTILFLSLAIFSHFEWATFAYGSILLLIFLQIQKPSIVKVGFLFIAPILITAPWWGTVLHRHGLTPFISFLSAGAAPVNILTFPHIILLAITDEPFLPLVAVLGLIGLIIQGVKRKWLLPIWIMLPLVLAPRSAPNLTTVPLSLLAGIASSELFKVLQKINTKKSQKLIYAGIALLFLYSTASTLSPLLLKEQSSYYYPFEHLSTKQRQAMEWVKNNTSDTAGFLILTNRPGWGWAMDPVSEWFPTITKRKSITTAQGKEWLPHNAFQKTLDFYQETKVCNRLGGIQCLEQAVLKYNSEYQYIYIDSTDSTQNHTTLLKYQLGQNVNYKMIYEQEGIIIFERI